MPRKRDLNPDIWRSEQFLDLPSDTHRLTFIAAISLADDLGVGRVADLRRHTSIASVDMAPLERVRLLVTYSVPDGDEELRLYFIPKWCKHQLVNRPSPSKLQIPANWKKLVPSAFHERYRRATVSSVSAHGVLSERSVNPHGAISESSVNSERPTPATTCREFSESSVSAHGVLSESHVPPSPSPSPSPEDDDVRPFRPSSFGPSNEPAVPVVFRTPSEPPRPTSGTAGTAGSSAPPSLNGNGRYDRIGDVGPRARRASRDHADVDRGSPRAAAANGGAATAVLADEPDPTPGATAVDPTSVAAILKSLVPEDLGDPKRFLPFFHKLRRAGKAPNPDRQEVSHFALALECRRVGRNPVGLFISRVEEGDWSKVKPDDMVAAEVALGFRVELRGDADERTLESRARHGPAPTRSTADPRAPTTRAQIPGAFPEGLPAELRKAVEDAAPATREYLIACDAVAAWRRAEEDRRTKAAAESRAPATDRFPRASRTEGANELNENRKSSDEQPQ